MPDTTDDARVELLTSEALSAQQRAAVIDVCNAANDTDAFHELFSLVPPDGRHALVHRDAELVAHAVASTRGVQPSGLPILRTAYLDAVATRPDAQGRGYGTAAVTHLAEAITDYDIGCLQTDVAPFYERMGWQLWRGPLAGRGANGLIPTPDQTGVMVLPLPRTPRLDLDGLLTIESQPRRIWE